MKGTIAAKIKTGGGIDEESGMPIPVSSDWTNADECQYKAITLNNNGRYADGKFKQASYEITTENMEFTAEMIQLKDRGGKIVCEKEVISIETLEEVQRVKIVV